MFILIYLIYFKYVASDKFWYIKYEHSFLNIVIYYYL